MKWTRSKLGSGLSALDILQTTAHEIGHVLLGEGHPDKGEGAAALPGTNQLERLMIDGKGLPEIKYQDNVRAIARMHRLVKGEWDKAEVWLNSNISE